MGWEQYTYLALTFMGLGIIIAKWGQPRDFPYGWVDIAATGITLGLLYSGGFFGG